jgi:Zn-finger nucleic acid-binding protein
MTCPVCKTDTLGEITLLEAFPANQCPTCGGIWVPSNAFMSWKRAQGNQSEEIKNVITADPSWEINELKLCPASGHLLVRYKIFPDVDFYLDRCRHCNGVWMDKHEWDVLVTQNLHNHLNEFFTHVWQEKLHTAETKNNMDMLYLQKFGEEDYQYIQKVREWMQDHPKRGMLLAFLQADDPYKI